LIFSIGRDEIFHPSINRLLARVDPKSGAPRAATLVLGLFTAACCLLPSHVLLIFSSGIVVSSLAMVSLAVLVGRMKGLTGQPGYWRAPLFPLAPILGLGLAGVFLVSDLMDADAGRPSILILIGVMVAAFLWWRFVVSRRPGGWTPRLD
jgi:amino acid transporter